MAVKITSVCKGSPAYRCGVLENDVLLSVNGHNISDVLDYMFYAAEERIALCIERDGQHLEFQLRKSEYDDLGLEFSSFLMDEKRSCSNKCIFCFIDQMPPNMRQTLYFKDDDARLSFLQGNYVTLTNLKDEDVQRIIDMRLNINVSVHTTNPDLRCKMMNNRFAGEKLKYLKQMADSGLMLNCQIVLCPEINDGDELKRTLDDLEALMPNIQSVAVVPVGITKFRSGLAQLRPFTAEEARKAIDIIEQKQKVCLEKFDTRMVFAADEFYLLAGRDIPNTEYYEDYPQYENGVGLIKSLEDEFDDALEGCDAVIEKRRVTMATGTAAGDFIKSLAGKAVAKYKNLECRVVPIVNHYFGETITVAGLVTATDLIEQLKGTDIGDALIIPKVMLKSDEDVFLDDLTVDDVERELGVCILKTDNNGYDLLEKILGTEV